MQHIWPKLQFVTSASKRNRDSLEERLRQIPELHAAGLTVYEIATLLHTPRAAVRAALLYTGCLPVESGSAGSRASADVSSPPEDLVADFLARLAGAK